LALKLLHNIHRIYVRLLIITLDLRLEDLAHDFENLETPNDVEVLGTPDDLASFEIPDELASFELPDDLATFVIPDDVENVEISADVENFTVPAQNFLIQFSRSFLSTILEHNRHKMSANIGTNELSSTISSRFIILVIAPIEFGVLF
jgi:hypothetical protein